MVLQVILRPLFPTSTHLLLWSSSSEQLTSYAVGEGDGDATEDDGSTIDDDTSGTTLADASPVMKLAC